LKYQSIEMIIILGSGNDNERKLYTLAPSHIFGFHFD